MANFNYTATRSYPISLYITDSTMLYQSIDMSEFAGYKAKTVTASITYTKAKDSNPGGGARYNTWDIYFSAGNKSETRTINKETGHTYTETITLYMDNEVTSAMVGGSLAGGKYDSTMSISNATITISYYGEASLEIVAPVDNDEIAISAANTFSWTSNIPSKSVFTMQKLYWKKTTDSSYTSVDIDIKSGSYTFPANTFENGQINYYLYVVDSSNNVIQTAVQTVNVGIHPTLALDYPVATNLKNDITQIFTWEMSESVPTGQKSYELGYKKTSDTEWTTITQTSANQYHTFAANTFATAEYQWRLKVTNKDNNTTEYSSSTFNAIGATGAPVITSVTNSSIPTFTWTIESQDTFELEIFSGTDRLYSSGVCVGNNVRTFTPNIMLADGNYIVKMRSMNQYGYFTAWLEYAFNLNTTKPSAYTCYAYANNNLGVDIVRSLELDDVTVGTPSTAKVPDAIYVLKRVAEKNEEFAIIGKLSTTNEKYIFSDNSVIDGISYEYALRAYKQNGGYTDSNSVKIKIDYSGFCIYNDSDYINLKLTEDSLIGYSHSPSKTYSYSNTIGRTYPIKESSEWLNHTVAVSCYATYEEYEHLMEMYKSNNDLWFKNNHFSFAASIDDISITSAMLGMGYTLSLKISRIDEEEFMLF